MDAKEEKLEAGHRRRLRKKYIESGVDGVSTLNLVEILLFYSVKRSDTKPIATALMERYGGSLTKLFSADKEELLTVEGVGEKSAELIEFFGKTLRRCFNTDTDAEKEYIPDMLMLKGYAAYNYFYADKPGIEALYFDNSFNILSVDGADAFLTEYNLKNPDIIIRKGELVNASFIIVFIYREGGGFFPYDDEIVYFQELSSICKDFGMKLYDCVISDGLGTFSISGDYRTFKSLEDESE